ncbi:LysR family transcriptional regulator [Pseudomonas sp. SWRI92]|uniref:LysR family transcriptional regulator n=1 Tax=Pseudomonas marvdashtae TaxID=2745500 RepID=A0A923JR07_9PSED|nr:MULTISPECIES: LysR family transcriptional regulator [Pseudomonas]MBC3374451.1 LysR family transcriptional regulator [Pseudomonas sp. SWRI92]MBV4552792.1 LysR family transcriptional regulator [Pseudomonas marvdashtae]
MNQMLAMRVFRSIAEAKGFSAAAERLDTTHSSVSRHLQQLESALGVRLINRNTRHMSLTAAGEGYYSACVDILDRVDAASQAAAREQERPSGLLRISAPLVVGTLELAHWLPAFQARYPDIWVDLSCSDPLVDLVADGFDVALRICGPLADSSLVARQLSVSPLVLVAAPAYVFKCGLPRSVAELNEHRLLTYGASAQWTLGNESGQSATLDCRSTFHTDTITALHACALAGGGIAAFTLATVKDDLLTGRLVRILPEHTLGERHYYALYPNARHLPAKVRAFVDYMAQYYQGRG